MAETEGDMVRRHLREGEGHLASQRRIVDELKGLGAMEASAKALLATFEDLQEQHKAHLARLTGEGL